MGLVSESVGTMRNCFSPLKRSSSQNTFSATLLTLPICFANANATKYFSALNPLTLLEDAKTRHWELSLCKHIECIYISDNDAKSVGNAEAYIVPNCVIKEGYDSSEYLQLDTPNIGFLGNMAYQPNIDACLFLITTIFPRLRKLQPDIHLYIIGRNPGKELIERCNDPQIHVTGEVENIWDYVRSINTFVFPMLTGAGLQNKILEAMYAGKPVVTSTIGNAGIGATTRG